MNKSKYINPENCTSCGFCCKTFSLVYNKKDEKLNPNIFSEVQRFKDLKSNGKIIVTEDDKSYEVNFKFKCKHLKKKGKNYSCAIYNPDTRPLLCKEFPYEDTTIKDCRGLK